MLSMHSGNEKFKKISESAWDALRTVHDPEIPLDIVNLGLIYDMRFDPIEKSQDTFSVEVDLTLTSPTCPMAPYLFQSIHSALEILDGIESVTLNLVWDPPWSKDKISEVGKMELGIL